MIDIAPWIPLRWVRKLLARLAAEGGEGEVRGRAEAAARSVHTAPGWAESRGSPLRPAWAEGEPQGSQHIQPRPCRRPAPNWRACCPMSNIRRGTSVGSDRPPGNPQISQVDVQLSAVIFRQAVPAAQKLRRGAPLSRWTVDVKANAAWPQVLTTRATFHDNSQARFTEDALFVIYASHTGLAPEPLKARNNRFGMKIIGYANEMIFCPPPADMGHFIRTGMKIGINKDGVRMLRREVINWQIIITSSDTISFLKGLLDV